MLLIIDRKDISNVDYIFITHFDKDHVGGFPEVMDNVTASNIIVPNYEGKGDYGERLLPEDVYLMEIKTSLAKPLWLTHLLAELDIKRTRFSKYGTEFKNMINHTEHDEIEYKEVV